MIGNVLVILGSAWALLLVMMARTIIEENDKLQEENQGKDASREDTQALLSIIIVAHNEEEALPALLGDLSSILAFTKREVEILLVDERSSDGTTNLLQNFCEEHAKASLHSWSDTKGKCDALKKAIPLARGEYTLLSDADCRLNARWAESMGLELDSGFDLVSAPVLLHEKPEDPALSSPLFRLWQSLQWIALSGNATAFALIKKPISAYGANLAFRASYLKAMGGYAEVVQTRKAEDLELFMRMREHGASFKWSLRKESLVYTRAESFHGTARQLARWLRSLRGLPMLGQLFLLLAPLGALAPWFLLTMDPPVALAIITAQVFAQYRLFHTWSHTMHTAAPSLGSSFLWQAIWPVVMLRVFVALAIDERDWSL